MPVKAWVLVGVTEAGSSSRTNGVGARPPVVLKEKSCASFGTASLMIVIEAGKMTASADSERSWLTPEPLRAPRRMWYGEPVIETAELFIPQSCRVEMWPPQARTAVAVGDVNVRVMLVVLSPA